MRRYEIMVILDPDLEEKTIAPSLEAFLNVIRADGGTVHNIEVWGRRRLAYEINHKTEGNYVVWEIVTETAGLPVTERQLRLADDIVRHKLFRLPEKEAAKRGLFGETAPAAAG